MLFFSRGRGKGHAIPDIAIAGELRKYRPGIRLQFVSYAIGHEVLASAGEPVIDLDLPEANSPFETLVKAARLIRDLRPRLVVSHEELAVLPAAAVCERQAVFLSHWFPPALNPATETLRFATEVLFMQRPGLFAEPGEVAGRVRYLGPLVRRLEYGPDDRNRAREELDVPPADKLILVLPGSPPEALTPIRALVLQAFQTLPHATKRLIWVAGKDAREIAACTNGHPQITVVESDSRLDRLMTACDVVITKGTYNIGCELAALGIRSVSISHGRNPIDDIYARASVTNKALYAQETTVSELVLHLNDAMNVGRAAPDLVALSGQSAAPFAQHLARLAESCSRAGDTC